MEDSVCCGERIFPEPVRKRRDKPLCIVRAFSCYFLQNTFFSPFFGDFKNEIVGLLFFDNAQIGFYSMCVEGLCELVRCNRGPAKGIIIIQYKNLHVFLQSIFPSRLSALRTDSETRFLGGALSCA